MSLPASCKAQRSRKFDQAENFRCVPPQRVNLDTASISAPSWPSEFTINLRSLEKTRTIGTQGHASRNPRFPLVAATA